MSDRKVMLLPLTCGTITFLSTDAVSVSGEHDRVDLRRDQIVGAIPDKGESVLVIDLQDLADALRHGDDELVEVDVCGTVVKETDKALVIQLADDRKVMLPKRFVSAQLHDYVKEVRLPRWLALEREL